MNGSAPKSVFRQSLPVTLTSFVNKVGDIGLRVFPMLLIEVKATPDQSSLVMGFVKGAAVVSILAGGWLSDRFGSKRIILFSFLCSASGMFVLAGLSTLSVICLAGIWISFGQGLFAAPLRLLLFETAEPNKRQEALAWLRSGNNAAVMTANAVAYFGAQMGLVGLFLFDGLTSLLAIILGSKWLPSPVKAKGTEVITPKHESSHIDSGSRWKFFGIALVVASFTLVMETFFVASAALAKLKFQDHGVALFAQVYMINTGLCMLFAVLISRWIKSAKFSLPIGTLLQLLGLVLILQFHDLERHFYVAVLLQALGEVIFTATAQYTLMRSLPASSKPGTIYSISMLMQQCGKVIGGMAAFQLIR